MCLPPPLPPAPPAKTYFCQRVPALASPLVIDGNIDKLAWKEIAWTDDFVDIEGDLKPKPRFRTRIKMMWDDTNFYVAAQMEEPHVWGTLTQRDSVIFHDNDFEVFLNPSCDTRNYYELEVNALNTVWDLLLRIHLQLVVVLRVARRVQKHLKVVVVEDRKSTRLNSSHSR